MNRILKSPIVISGILHLLVLLILALVVLNPIQKQVWHEFDWVSSREPKPPEPVVDEAAGTEALEIDETEGEDLQVSQAPLPPDEASEEPQRSESPVSAPALPIREDLIQTPNLAPATVSNPPTSYNPPDRRTRLTPGAVTRPGSGQNDGFELLQGEGVVGINTPLPRVDTTDHAILEMSFRLDSDGKVVMNSLNVERLSSSDHIDATRLALSNWRFRFLGAYNPNQIYRVRFIFTPRSR